MKIDEIVVKGLRDSVITVMQTLAYKKTKFELVKLVTAADRGSVVELEVFFLLYSR